MFFKIPMYVVYTIPNCIFVMISGMMIDKYGLRICASIFLALVKKMKMFLFFFKQKNKLIFTFVIDKRLLLEFVFQHLHVQQLILII